jgi:hypothetical protein
MIRGAEGACVVTLYWRDHLNKLRKGLPAEICPTSTKIDWLRKVVILGAVFAVSSGGLWYVAHTQREQPPRDACASLGTSAVHDDCVNAFHHEYDRRDPAQP